MLRARAGQGPEPCADCRSGAYPHRHSPKVPLSPSATGPLDRSDLPQCGRDPEALTVAHFEVAQPGHDLAQPQVCGALERTVRMVAAELHRAVDVGRLGDSLAGGVVGLVDD